MDRPINYKVTDEKKLRQVLDNRPRTLSYIRDIARGLTYAAIAKKHGLASKNSIHSRVNLLFKVLGVDNKQQAIHRLIELGYLPNYQEARTKVLQRAINHYCGACMGRTCAERGCPLYGLSTGLTAAL